MLICGDGDSIDGDGVGMETEAAGMGWDGFCIHGDGRGWGSVSVPMQTSTADLYLLENTEPDQSSHDFRVA